MMNEKETVIREVGDLSPSLLPGVLDLIPFLKMKAAREQLETTVLSESALQKDWLLSEEDKAWRDL